MATCCPCLGLGIFLACLSGFSLSRGSSCCQLLHPPRHAAPKPGTVAMRTPSPHTLLTLQSALTLWHLGKATQTLPLPTASQERGDFSEVNPYTASLKQRFVAAGLPAHQQPEQKRISDAAKIAETAFRCCFALLFRSAVFKSGVQSTGLEGSASPRCCLCCPCPAAAQRWGEAPSVSISVGASDTLAIDFFFFFLFFQVKNAPMAINANFTTQRDHIRLSSQLPMSSGPKSRSR